jgi:chromosome segregation ATPase
MSVSSDELDLSNNPASAYQELAGMVNDLQEEVAELHGELAEKEARIDALQKRLNHEQEVHESLFGTLGDVGVAEAALEDLLIAGEPVGTKLDQREREQRATEQYVFGQ